MTLEEYDSKANRIWVMRNEAADLVREANEMEDDVWRSAGLEEHNRDPGFPCWTHKDLRGYYGTPREALKALVE